MEKQGITIALTLFYYQMKLTTDSCNVHYWEGLAPVEVQVWILS